MDLSKTGNLISELRREKGITQREVAEQLGVCAKTISKWERGHGFPDITLVSNLSELFRVDLSILLEGEMPTMKWEVGNVRRIKFYVCEKCGNVISSMGEAEITCCGRKLTPLIPKEMDELHHLDIEVSEGDFYITFSHPMTKEHFVSFVSYVRFDRVLTVKLYPEQGGEIRIPQMRGGKLYFYCNNHGFFTTTP